MLFFWFTVISIYKLQIAIRYFQTVSQAYNCFNNIGLRCSYSFLIPGKLKCVSSVGGKDRRSGLILTIPLCLEQTNMDELSVTLDYLLSIPRWLYTCLSLPFQYCFLLILAVEVSHTFSVVKLQLKTRTRTWWQHTDKILDCWVHLPAHRFLNLYFQSFKNS